MAFKLCSVQDIKDRSKGGIDLGTTFDTLLGQIIDVVTFQLAQYCGRPDWDVKTRTEYYNPGEATKRIFVASPPVVSSPVIQVYEDTALPRVYGADTLLVLDTDYFVLDAGIITKPYTNAVWAQGIKTVKVIYTGGYLTADASGAALKGAPVDLWDAAVIQAKLAFDRREAAGINSESLGGASFSFSSGLKIDPAVAQKLINYIVYPGPF